VIILVLLAVMAAPSSPPWLAVWNAGPVLNRPDRERTRGSAERRLFSRTLARGAGLLGEGAVDVSLAGVKPPGVPIRHGFKRRR